MAPLLARGESGPARDLSMALLDRWRRGLRALLRRGAVTREMDDEIAAHLAFATDELVAQGVEPAEAARRARVEFGNVQRVRERAFEERTFAWVDDFLRDLGQSWRQLRRTPFATMALVLTAALGIAGVTTVFSFVNSMWLRPLPYEQDEELHGVQVISPKRYVTTYMRRAVADSVQELLRPAARTALFAEHGARVDLPDSAVFISATQVDSAAMSILRIAPREGRAFTPAEYAMGAAVALLAPALWMQLPKEARDADTARIDVDGVSHRVVGVMAQGERFHERSLAWVPLRDSQPDVSIMIRRDPGVSEDSLTGLLATAGRIRLPGAVAAPDTGLWRVSVAPLHDRGHKTPIYMVMLLFAVIVGLLATATASNVATQLVVRAERRRHELATSAALGATTERLARRLLADQVIIGIAAGIVGTIGSLVGVHLLLARIDTRGFPGWISFAVDWRILLFAIVATIWLIAAIGVLPARVGTRIDLTLSMREAGTIGVTSHGSRRATSRLLALQVALSLALVTSAVVAVQAYRGMTGIKEDTQDGKRFDIYAFGSSADAGTDSSRRVLYDSLAVILPTAHRARTALHGYVRGVRIAQGSLGTANDALIWRPREDRPARLYAVDDTTRALSGSELVNPNIVAVDPAFFELDGRRVLKGRVFTDDDARAAMVPIVVTADLAMAVWRDTTVLGRVVRIGRDGPLATIVGVVTPRTGIRSDRGGLRIAPRPEFFMPRARADLGQPKLRVEATAGLEATRWTAQLATRRIARQFTLGQLRTISEENSKALLPMRIVLSVLGGAALLVIGISLVGLHGIASQAALARRPEIGVRLALGATERQLVRLVIGDTLRSTRSGLVAGLAISVVALIGFQRLVPFDVRDILLPTALAAAAFTAVVLLTCWLPARRAARIAPADVLRSL